MAASSYRLGLNGKIEAFGLKAFREENNKPIFDADSAKIEWSIQARKKPALQFTDIVLSGGTFYQPAVHSPDGMHSILLSELAMDLQLQKDRLLANAVCAKMGDWTLRGQMNLGQLTAVSEKGESVHPLDSFYKIAAQIQTFKTEHDYLKQPTIDFKIQSNDVVGAQIDLLISTQSVDYSTAHIKQATLDIAFRLNGQELSLRKPVLLNGSRIDIPSHGLSATDASCWLQTNKIDKLLNQQLPQIDFSAQKIAYADNQLNHSLFRLKEISSGCIHLSGSTSFGGSVSRMKGIYDLKESSGNLQASGRLSWPSIIHKLPEGVQKKLPSVQFHQELDYEAKIDLTENNKLTSVYFDVKTKKVTVDDLLFNAIQVKGRYEDGTTQIDTLKAYRDDQHVHASGEFNNKEKNLHILAHGDIQPKDYSKILPTWWGGIFKDFTFKPDVAVQADFAVRSAYTEKAATDFFGEVSLKDATYSKVPLEEARITVKGNPLHIHLDISEVASSEGSFAGSIDLTRRQDGIPSLVALHLNVETELSIDGTRKLIGEILYNRIVGDFTFTERPKIKLHGSSYFTSRYPEYKNKSYFSFQADANGPLVYSGAPIDYLRLNGYSDDAVTQLRDINFGYADGFGNGVIDLWSRPRKPDTLCFKMQLNNADEQKAIAYLPALDSLEDNFQTKQEIKSNSTSHAGSGSLDAYLHAIGPLDDPYNYSGNGNFTIRDKQLGAIQLLGPLSILLQGTALGFTSFELNEMSAQISLEKEIVQFTDLQVNGPLTRIEASGSMGLESQMLDMRVAVHLFGNTSNRKNPIIQITNLVNPLSTLLQFELSGTLEKQKWRSIYDPRKLIPGL
ncbi:MAG: AsmA-like C-terminal region-containing protein [Coraliomargaritaceae bacterium]